MDETDKPSPQPAPQPGLIRLAAKASQDASEARKSQETLVYSEQAIWLCENRKTRYKTRINGVLAEILKQYPQDYKLRLLSIKEAAHEHPAATGQ